MRGRDRAHGASLLAAMPAAAALRADPDAVVRARVAARRGGRRHARRARRARAAARPRRPPPARRRAPRRLPRARLPGRRARRRASSSCLRRAGRADRPPARDARSRCPPGVIEDVALREPIGARHPLRIAEAVARLGGQPAGAHDDLEDAVLAVLGAERRAYRARTRTPIPACARRAGSSSGSTAWASGAATTPSSPTSPRGFAGNDRALAQEVGEALLEAGLLAEKPSRRPAPRLPQPAQGGRDPQADRDGRRSHRVCGCRPSRRMPPCRRRFRSRVSSPPRSQTKLHTLVTLTRAGHRAPRAPGPPLAHGARAAALRHDARRGLHGRGAQLPGRAGA